MADEQGQSGQSPAGAPVAAPTPAPGAPAGWGQPPQQPGWGQPYVDDGKMRRRQKLVNAALPVLPPGTQIRQIIPATTRPMWLWIVCALALALLPGSLLFMAINRSRLLAVTDEGIYVISCSAWFGNVRAKQIVAVLPRATRLGPPSGLQTRFSLGTLTLYLGSQAFGDQIVAADMGQGMGSAQPSQAMAAAGPIAGGYPQNPGAQPGWSSPAGPVAQPSYAGPGVPYPTGPNFAGFWIRLVAYLIDAAIIFGLSITVIGLVVAIPYMPVMWWKKGATLGQRAMGLKVVRAADGGPVDGLSATVRFIVILLENIGSYLLIGLLGFIWAAFEPRKRAWHDMAAGTVVIHAN